jgi:hypothetical protein
MRVAVPPLPQYVFMAWYSVKAQGHVYLYLYLSRYQEAHCPVAQDCISANFGLIMLYLNNISF